MDRRPSDAARLELRRERAGAGFRYRNAAGRIVKDTATLKRIRTLAIPPAYRQVRISAEPESCLQAIGVDARGRKQYRYHPRWREQRDSEKFQRMLSFARALPMVRRRVARDLLRPGLGHDKVVAALVALLEQTLIRVGNEAYARTNRHYGLTTLRERHVSLHGEHLRFHFIGKSGVTRDVQLDDPLLAQVVGGLLELPGSLLFRYRDSAGALHRVRSDDVNTYLKKISGEPFTAKDFRTWAATVYCALALTTLCCKGAATGTKIKTKATVLTAVKEVAGRLGNTPAVCRKSYIHPVIIEEFLDNGLAQLVISPHRTLDFRRHLHGVEGSVLKFLERASRRHRGDLESQVRASLAQVGSRAAA